MLARRQEERWRKWEKKKRQMTKGRQYWSREGDCKKNRRNNVETCHDGVLGKKRGGLLCLWIGTRRILGDHKRCGGGRCKRGPGRKSFPKTRKFGEALLRQYVTVKGSKPEQLENSNQSQGKTLPGQSKVESRLSSGQEEGGRTG